MVWMWILGRYNQKWREISNWSDFSPSCHPQTYHPHHPKILTLVFLSRFLWNLVWMCIGGMYDEKWREILNWSDFLPPTTPTLPPLPPKNTNISISHPILMKLGMNMNILYDMIKMKRNPEFEWFFNTHHPKLLTLPFLTPFNETCYDETRFVK